jgi:hypothetical protein
MPRRGVAVWLYSSFTFGARGGGGWLKPFPCRFTPVQGKTQYPLYRRLGGSQGWSGKVWKISPTLGFNPRTVQPVAIRCTDYVIPAHQEHVYLLLGSKYTLTFNK